MKIKRKIVWIILIIIIIISISFFLKNSITSSSNLKFSKNIGYKVGDTAPDFTIIDVDNKKITLNQLKNKPIVISFFATWCTPCQIEADNIKKLDDETKGKKFVVYQIGIDNRESLDDLKKFKSNIGNEDWIVGFGFNIAKKFNVRSLDTTIILDKNKNIIYRDNGIPASVEELRKYLI